MRDLKYLSAYLVPFSAILALQWQGIWSWATVVLTFGILPLTELFAVKSTHNVPVEMEDKRAKAPVFSWLLYLNIPLVFGIVAWYISLLDQQHLNFSTLLGLTLSAGIVVGTNGINVAHELGHRSSLLDQQLSKLLLLPALYQHFFIEHNRGHHKNVATDKDPATARLHENVYTFWVRSVAGSWTGAWALERVRLQKANQAVWSWQNEMVRFCVFQFTWLALIFIFGGWKGFAGAIAVATVGFLLLESINYIEHYGLQRRMLASGHLESVLPAHSWNSNHEIGRIFLYELTRHSDHHFKSNRQYQILRHLDESPQLPFGYPMSILIALVPPLWFALMNPRIEKVRFQHTLSVQ